MLPYKKVVFVCHSNEALSIMAEAIMNHLQEKLPAERRVYAVSRGLVVLFSAPINPKVATVIEKNGLKLLRENTLELTRDDLSEDALIVAINSKEKKMIEDKYPGVMNLYELRDFSGEGGEITEPYGGSLEDYETIFEHIDLMIKLMIEKIWPKEAEKAKEE